MAVKKLPDVEYLRKLFDYDAETGILRWRQDARCRNGSRHPHAGKSAGDPNKASYRIVVVDAVKYRAHRIIWMLMTGEEPTCDIDHANGDPGDNRWTNLRHAPHADNMRNMRRHKDNQSGYKGVDYLARCAPTPWRASIYVNNKLRHLGLFPTPEDAHAAYCRSAKEHFGEFFNPG